jgi:hypothetical protein
MKKDTKNYCETCKNNYVPTAFVTPCLKNTKEHKEYVTPRYYELKGKGCAFYEPK